MGGIPPEVSGLRAKDMDNDLMGERPLVLIDPEVGEAAILVLGHLDGLVDDRVDGCS